MFKVRCHRSIRELPQEVWSDIEDPDSPFSDYEFLVALEESQCVGPRSGQVPHYLTLWKDDILFGGVICYEKSHSYGEYIFDWAWADAAARAGIPYYDKLVVNTPFTPASCRKLLHKSGLTPDERALIGEALVSELEALSLRLELSSTHLLFLSSEELTYLPEQYHSRHSMQYHWQNRNYASFDGFLGMLRSRKAKQIRRERARTMGLTVQSLWGESLSEDLVPEFHKFYLQTIEEKGAIPYLNEDFFRRVFATMSDRLLLVRAIEGSGEAVAAALFFHKGERLYGRYWGSTTDREFLHFELCYYRGMDFAIAKGKSVFEAGAQGEHKVARGFAPTRILSAHKLRHPGLHQAVGQFIAQEKLVVSGHLEELARSLPYRSPEER